MYKNVQLCWSELEIIIYNQNHTFHVVIFFGSVQVKLHLVFESSVFFFN